MRTRELLYTILALALAVLLLSAVPIGIAVFVLGFVYGDSPCVMCWEQRIGMALVALVGLFVLRYGPKPKYIGLGVLIAIWGVFMGIRHTGMHAARDVGQGFSAEILGAHTYTWALLIYWVCVATMGAAADADEEGGHRGPAAAARPAGRARRDRLPRRHRRQHRPGVCQHRSAAVHGAERSRAVLLLAEALGVVARRMVAGAHLAARAVGDRQAEPRGASGRTRRGPIAERCRSLPVERELTLGFPLSGTPTDLAYDPATNAVPVTTRARASTWRTTRSAKLNRYTIVDAGFSVDLGRFAGAAFLDKGMVLAVGENKSYVVLEPSDKADADANFRFFLESFDTFDEVSRSRFGTVRARMMYVMSAAYDSGVERPSTP